MALSAPRRVLVIDDDPLVRRVVVRTLKHHGHAAESAESLNEGLRLLAVLSFDVVVTDMYMPDQDGLDTLRTLKALVPTVPVVVMSGQLVGAFGDTLRTVVGALGAAAALPKAGDYAELVRVIESLPPPSDPIAPEPPSVAN